MFKRTPKIMFFAVFVALSGLSDQGVAGSALIMKYDKANSLPEMSSPLTKVRTIYCPLRRCLNNLLRACNGYSVNGKIVKCTCRTVGKCCWSDGHGERERL